MQETLAMARSEVQREARERAYATPLEDFHVGHPELFHTIRTGPVSSACAPRSRSTGAPRARSAPTGR